MLAFFPYALHQLPVVHKHKLGLKRAGDSRAALRAGSLELQPFILTIYQVDINMIVNWMEGFCMSNTVRVNTGISKRANEWLNKRSKETGLSKSALINVAIDNYIREVEVVEGLPQILKELEKHGIDLSELKRSAK